MKILIVAQYFPPDITAAAFRMFETARLLEAKGHQVRVITAEPHRSQVHGDSATDYDSKISHVRRTRVARLNGGGASDYIRHYTSFMLGSAWLGIRERLAGWRPDVIWASSPPLFVGLSGVAISRACRVPLVLDIRDIWPASAVGAGQLSADGRAYRIGERMERFIYSRAAHVTCVAQPMAEYIRTKTDTPVTVVYNGTNASDITTQSTRARGPNSDRTLLYAGNLGRAQQLDLLIRAWAKVSRSNGHSEWKLKFLGTGAVENDLKELATELGVSESVVFMPPVSKRQAMSEMSRAGALSVSLQPDKVFEKTIPSKVFDCMAVGRPILAGVAGEARDILDETGGNVCYQPGNRDGLEDALRTLVRDYPHLRQKACANTQRVLKAYTREKAVNVLIQVLHSVVANTGAHAQIDPVGDTCEAGMFKIETKGMPGKRNSPEHLGRSVR